jgi:hypothetical protein
MRRTRRSSGYIVHIGESRSAGFWAVIKAHDDGKILFGYGKNFLNPVVPKIGHEVLFARLPPADRGDLDRATEIAIIKQTRGGQITVEHHAGATRLVLRAAGRDRLLGELML